MFKNRIYKYLNIYIFVFFTLKNTSNLVTPRNGELIIAATQDFLTSAYLMTLKDRFLSKEEITVLAGWLVAGKDMDMDVELPPPCILKVNNLNSFVFVHRPS